MYIGQTAKLTVSEISQEATDVHCDGSDSLAVGNVEHHDQGEGK